jgi:hypothetical protein
MAKPRPHTCWGCGRGLGSVGPKAGARSWCFECRCNGTRDRYYAEVDHIAPQFTTIRVAATGGASTFRPTNTKPRTGSTSSEASQEVITSDAPARQ